MHDSMAKELITIAAIIPTFNRPKLLEIALKSVYRQTIPCDEVIVVDDTTNEDVLKENLRIVKNFTNVIYIINHSITRGACHCRNIGIHASTSEWLAFLDDDDEWLDNKNEIQIKKILNCRQDIGLVYGQIIYKNTSGSTWKKAKKEFSGKIHKQMLISDKINGTPTWLVKREILDKVGYFDETLSARQDWDLATRLSKESIIEYVSEYLLIVLLHENARISDSRINRYNSNIKIYKKYKSEKMSTIDKIIRYKFYIEMQLNELVQIERHSLIKLNLIMASVVLSPLRISTYKAIVKFIISLFR